MTHHDSIKTESRQKGFISNALGKGEKISARIESEANNSLERTLKNVGGSLSGLTESQVSERLTRHGFNEVAHDKPPHALIQLLLAFKNPFVLVLLFLACVSGVTDVYLAPPGEAEWTGIMILVTMVIISSLLRFWQEYRSGKAAERLKSMVHNTATVLRRISGTTSPIKQEVAMRELVAGDIVYLSAGDMIPADIRLIESRDLFISQAVLTGEALPVEKYDTLGAVSQKSAQVNEQAPSDLLDLTNICFMGTNVVSGTATAVVVATGAETYFGSLARNVVSHKRIETSFDRGVSSVSWLLIKFMMVMVPIVFLLNGLTKGDWMSALTFALAVAVGLTPEMLPMIVSANLAKGALAMSRRKVVVKRLNSVQNFGASGQLESEIYGQAARHYPDSDTLEIDKMRMHSVAANGQATRASADRALSNADGSEVQLFGHAVVIREPLGATQPPLEFRGDFLHIWPRKEQVRSNQPVSLARGKDHFTADTLEYDHGSQVLQLQGHVRGVLMPGH